MLDDRSPGHRHYQRFVTSVDTNVLLIRGGMLAFGLDRE